MATSTPPGGPPSDNPQSQKVIVTFDDVTDGPPEKDEDEFLTGVKLWFTMLGVMANVFLLSLDRTIIGTAIPLIVKGFQSVSHIGWYGSAYLLTGCAFQPMFGKIYAVFPTKTVYLLSLSIFFLGSLVCAAAPNSVTLIIGRAVAGVGSAGMVAGSFLIVVKAVPLNAGRPLLQSVVGIMFAAGASVGPFLGGIFTDMSDWRWCFWTNLPIAGVVIVTFFMFIKPWKNPQAHRPVKDRLWDLDLLGNILILGSFTMLFVAIQQTAIGVPWRSQEIIGLMTGFGVTGVLFVGWQFWKGDAALIPPRIVGQRTVAASCLMSFLSYGALTNINYFWPIWFQVVRGETAMMSGVYMMPYFVVMGVFSVLAGYLAPKIGYVTPLAVTGNVIATIGLGLMTMLSFETTTAQWVGFQVLTGAGHGLMIQQGFTAIQTVLRPSDIPVGTTAVISSQSLGGAIFLTVGNSVFQSKLMQSSAQERFPGVMNKILETGTSSLRKHVGEEQIEDVLVEFNGAISEVMWVVWPLGILAVIAACFIAFKLLRPSNPEDEEQRHRWRCPWRRRS
ncbi:major facilitator superfamily transporter [Podospora conica]|nr:major facilitator superfamily transporter [Schizothecium conicum]